MFKVLVTSTSFQDVQGLHQTLLINQGYELVKLRGPLKEDKMIQIIAKFDAILCGDDEITSSVIEKGSKGNLKVISKYGIGLDKIDLVAASNHNIKVTNCPGINKVSVSEHVFALLLAFSKNLLLNSKLIEKQKWKRLTGFELYAKTFGILGTGNIGKEVIKKAILFGMNVIAYDKKPDFDFESKYNFKYCSSIKEVLNKSEVLSLNLSLDHDSKHIIDSKQINYLKEGVIIINTARGDLVQNKAILEGLKTKKIGGYLTDVLEEEPMIKDHPFLEYDNVIITPHVGSRTYENVINQGKMAVNNLVESLK